MGDSNIATFTKEFVIAASTKYFGGDKLPASVFADKYALRDRDEVFYEATPDAMHWRLASEFARIEAKYPHPLSVRTIYQYLADFRYIVPQGSPMFGIGNPHQLVSLSNCSVLDGPNDTMSSIMETGRDLANLYKRRFGAGTDLSKLRPSGASVNNAAITSTGAASFMDLYSYITRMVGQSGRRGALMLSLDVRHPDIERFVTMKSDPTKVTGANVSVRITDDFMLAVQEDQHYSLSWPIGAPAKVGHLTKAKEIFKLIAAQSCATAEPGLLFWDTIQRNLPLDFYREDGFETTSTNPCVTGDTHILTVDGPRTFKDLADDGKDVLVYAVDKETNEPVVRWMRKPRKTRENAEVLEIVFDSGLVVRATPDHNFIRFQNGEKIQAKDLKPGTSISAFSLQRHRDGHQIVSRGVRGTDHGTYYRYVHRMVADALGWNIDEKVIHHVDENPDNNRPTNLEVLTDNAAHNRKHYRSRRANGFNGHYERTQEVRDRTRDSVNAYYAEHGTAHLNHKVVSVTSAGRADVFNGTVDDVHTYIIADPEAIHESAIATGILSANCGELPLCADDSCRLISIYLPNFVVNEFTEDAYFDFDKFIEVVAVAQRLCDDLVDLELEKLTAIHAAADTADEKAMFMRFISKCESGRRTGLGTHGLADALARLQLRYGSEESIPFTWNLYDTFKVAAYTSSVDMAEQRGAFPIWNYETEGDCEYLGNLPEDLQDRMHKVGRRNGALLTLAPTGSVSILSNNCSSGMEPVYANRYTRRRKIDPSREDLTTAYRDAQGDYWIEFEVRHPNVERYLRRKWEAAGFYEPFESWARDEVLPDYFVTSADIDPLQRVTMQATITSHIDHSVSSTINLPKGTTPEKVEEIYMAAWKQGCKGITVYVDGSRDAQVLTASPVLRDAVEDTITIPAAPEALGIALNRIKALESTAAQFRDMEREADDLIDFLNDEIGRYKNVVGGIDEQVSRYVNDEYKVCPTGIGFVEYIEGLTKEIEILREGKDELGKQLHEAKRTDARTDARIHRETETHGSTYKAAFNNIDGKERKVYVYIGQNDSGQTVEVFIHDEKGDEDLRPYASAVGKLISLLLKYGVPSEAIESTLVGLKGGSVSYNGHVYNSVPDLVGQRLRVVRETEEKKRALITNWGTVTIGSLPNVASSGFLKADIVSGVIHSFGAEDLVLATPGFRFEAKATAKVTDVPVTENGEFPTNGALASGMKGVPLVTIPKGDQCPSCQGRNVRRVDSCPTCPDCGWSRCS